ncbi:MAG: hypothetical protein ABIW86_08320, partial [Flavobacterium sp.]
MFRRRMSRLGMVMALVGTSALAPTAYAGATVPPAATITALPLPPGDTGGDILSAAGQWAVGLVTDDALHQHVAIWRGAGNVWSVRDLGDFGITEPNSGLSATGVNAKGQVSIGINTGAGMGGWFLDGATVHQLVDFAGGTNAYARAINAGGEIVGEALDEKGNDFAAVWPHWWSAPIQLAPTAGFDGSYAQGVDSRGDVVGGSFSNGPAPTLPVVWGPRGTPRILPDLGMGGDLFDRNTRGRTVGQVFTATGAHAAVWDRGRLRDLGVFADDTFSRAIGVGASGEVVGFAGTRFVPGSIPLRQIVFWPGFGPARSLLPLDLSWRDNAYAHAIVGDTIFGTSMASHGARERPTVWSH